jgi:hypothetical protein
MKKQHDAASLTNELEGASAFFQERKTAFPASTESLALKDRPISRPTNRLPDASATRSADPSVEPLKERPASQSAGSPGDQVTSGSTPQPARRPIHRTLQRRSFEFYADQLETLKTWSLQAQLLGEKVSMSEMIRAALDRYLRDEARFHPPADDPTTRPANPSAGERVE